MQDILRMCLRRDGPDSPSRGCGVGWVGQGGPWANGLMPAWRRTRSRSAHHGLPAGAASGRKQREQRLPCYGRCAGALHRKFETGWPGRDRAPTDTSCLVLTDRVASDLRIAVELPLPPRRAFLSNLLSPSQIRYHSRQIYIKNY